MKICIWVIFVFGTYFQIVASASSWASATAGSGESMAAAASSAGSGSVMNASPELYGDVWDNCPYKNQNPTVRPLGGVPKIDIDPNFCLGSNEVWTECENNECQQNCQNYNIIPIRPCDNSCISGCICRRGYLRNSKGICVRPNRCDKNICPDNQEYVQCVSTCRETCATLGQNRPCRETRCVPGCQCKSGYYATQRGNCVRPRDCDICRGPNEIWSLCDNNSCQRNCKNLRIKDMPCEEICVSGCVCVWGFLRNSRGQCVRPENCDGYGTK